MNASEYARRTYERQIHARFSYLGSEIWQYLGDLAAMQWAIGELAPLLVIELGTFYGGHARFMADCMDAADGGHVVTVDSADYPDAPGAYRPEHPRVTYLTGRTDDGAMVATCCRLADHWDGAVMVLHDACHEGPQVLADLRLYAPLITVGSFLLVQDTNLDHPTESVFPDGEWGPGPYGALVDFLGSEPDGRWEWEGPDLADPVPSFGPDVLTLIREGVTFTRQSPLLTASPDGWVRRVG